MRRIIRMALRLLLGNRISRACRQSRWLAGGAAAGGGFALGAAAVPWGRHGSGSDV